MSLEERDRLLAMIADRPRGAAEPAARRAGFEAMARALWGDAYLPPAFELAPGLVARWAPAPPAPGSPVLLWLHGGAFILGSSASHWPMAAAIAREGGVGVLLPDYALAPERPFPAALEDAGRALDALERLGFGMAQVAVGGDSAGGNLAVAAVQDRLRAGRAAPRGCWLVSPYLDLTHAGASFKTRRARDPFVDPEDGTGDRYRAVTPATDPRVSPLGGPLAGFPETLVQVGSEEVLYDDARSFAGALWQADRPAIFQEWAGMIHIWPFFAPVLAEGRAAIGQGGNFLRSLFAA
jgi:phosphinothricin tripeptide acetyl hydrolase